MQCYEYQLMLARVFDLITLTQPGFKYDFIVLSDILAELDVDTLQDLDKVDPRLIRMQALAYLQDYQLAA